MIHDWKFSCWLLLVPLDLQASLWGLRSVHTARAKEQSGNNHMMAQFVWLIGCI